MSNFLKGGGGGYAEKEEEHEPLDLEHLLPRGWLTFLIVFAVAGPLLLPCCVWLTRFMRVR